MTHGDNVIKNTAQALGTVGVDYATTGTTVFAYSVNHPGWYGFVVNADAVIDTATFKDKDGNTTTVSQSWFDVTLSQGMWIPSGNSSQAGGEDVWITSITVTSGSILLYRA
jgi:hypothetical protein